MSRSKLVVKGDKYDSSDRVRADRTDLLYSHIPEGETLVSIKDLNVTYRTDEKTTVAVDDLSFDIKKGELVSIVGPSGCGKSTILRCISGLLQPTSGEILIGGNKCTTAGSDRGMVFQDFALFPWRSVRKNVEFGLEIAGVPKEERQERSDRYLKAMGLSEFADSRIHELSGGMKQRVGIARAMIMDPKFIVADEPISALDVSIRAQVLNLMNRLKAEKNLTYLFIAHDLSVVRFIADRIAVIHLGEIVEIAESETLFKYPLHPYTVSLLSTVPMPDPLVEKNRKHIVYDPDVLDQSGAPRTLREIRPGHFVFATDSEFAGYEEKLQGLEKILNE